MKNKYYLKLLLVLMMFSLVFWGAHYFLYNDIKNKNVQILTLDNQLKTLNTEQEYISTTERMLESRKSDIDRIENSIIVAGGDVNFIEMLELVARNNGLTLDIESLVATDADKSSANLVTALKVKAKTSGSWSGSYLFLSELESLPYKIKVTNFSIISNTPEVVDVLKKEANSWQTIFEITVLKYK